MRQKVNTEAHVVVFVRFIHFLLNDTSYCKTVRHYITIKHVFAETKCFVIGIQVKSSIQTN